MNSVERSQAVINMSWTQTIGWWAEVGDDEANIRVVRSDPSKNGRSSIECSRKVALVLVSVDMPLTHFSESELGATKSFSRSRPRTIVL